jgi:glutathione S-transferase
MSDIILHHFDISPFAEKVRVALGVKGLAWHSVQIPLVLPKPDLTALTGGYRKTPVMQIGADIYCDTQRIVKELDTRFAGPSLFPNGTEGLCQALASWSDLMLFRPGAGLSMGTNRDLPEDIKRDRFAFFDFLDEDSLAQQLPHLFGQFRANLLRLQGMLSDGRAYLTGEVPSWADAACYAPVWMCRGNIQGADELLQGLQHLSGWEQRVASLGHGQRTEMIAEDALSIAQRATADIAPEYVDDPWSKLKFGNTVSVTPDDYGAVPVAGELMSLTDTEIAIGRDDERAGQVVVHFPRSGYRVDKL